MILAVWLASEGMFERREPTEEEKEALWKARLWQMCKHLGKLPDEILDGLSMQDWLSFEAIERTMNYIERKAIERGRSG